jgi:peptidase M49-like protein
MLHASTHVVIVGAKHFSSLYIARLRAQTPPTGRTRAMRTASTALDEYAVVRLEADLSGLSAAERAMVPLLVEASDLMDELFWLEAVGASRTQILDAIDDPALRRLAELNYGPWDRLHADRPIVPGTAARPPGGRCYPSDMTSEEFEAAAGSDGEAMRSPYTLVRRDAARTLVAVPYHVQFESQVRRAAALLRSSAALAEDEGLRRYLDLRATALETDDYYASDLAWLDMRANRLELVIGPIETYEDRLFGYKASHEALVLVKDPTWSDRLARYTALLPSLQAELPVPEPYRRERPGSEGDLQVYDAAYLAGHARALTPAAINLPNDERVQLEKGSRRLQIRNTMRAKFDAITRPIADVLIAADQRGHVAFDAAFELDMFHEVAHGLGIKHTIDGSATVRDALRDWANPIEEEKADVLGMFMLDRLARGDDVETQPALDRYVTYVAGLFRLARFGATSPYTISTVSQLAFLAARGALVRDARTGTYRVQPDRMPGAFEALAARLLILQGDGDLEGAADWCTAAIIGPDLEADLDRVAAARIPIEVFFENAQITAGP